MIVIVYRTRPSRVGRIYEIMRFSQWTVTCFARGFGFDSHMSYTLENGRRRVGSG
jgi:hypothetical protein